ncbi:MAG: MFS transporter [Pseudomonadota bacterium]
MTPSTRRAVFAFTLGCLGFAYAFVQRVAPSVMTGELMRDLSVGAAALGTLSAMYFYSYAVIQLPVGMLLDRFGPRKLLSAAMLVCAAASLAFAASDSVVSASLSRAMVGAAVAFCFVGTLTIANLWLPANRFATLAGLVQSVGMMGAMLGQAPLRWMVDDLGWRGSFQALAVVAALLAVSMFWVIPRRAQRADTQPANAANQQSDAGSALSVLKNPHTWRCALIGFALTPIMLAFAGLWAVPWMVQIHGFTEATAAGTASLLFLGWAVGSLLSGFVSDLIGRKRPVLLLGGCLCVVCYAALLFLPSLSHAALSALFVLIGLGGATMVLTFGLVRTGNPPAHAAAAMGVVNTCVVGSGAVMQPLIGWLLELYWDGQTRDGVQVFSESTYQLAFSSLLVLLAIGVVATWLMREHDPI